MEVDNLASLLYAAEQLGLRNGGKKDVDKLSGQEISEISDAIYHAGTFSAALAQSNRLAGSDRDSQFRNFKETPDTRYFGVIVLDDSMVYDPASDDYYSIAPYHNGVSDGKFNLRSVEFVPMELKRIRRTRLNDGYKKSFLAGPIGYKATFVLGQNKEVPAYKRLWAKVLKLKVGL